MFVVRVQLPVIYALSVIPAFMLCAADTSLYNTDAVVGDRAIPIHREPEHRDGVIRHDLALCPYRRCNRL